MIKPAETSMQVNNKNSEIPKAGAVASQDTSKEVTARLLDDAWARYASTVESENPRLFSILVNQKPVLVEGTTVELKLLNKTQEDEINSALEPLMQFLMNQLENNSLKLKLTQVEYNSSQQPRKAFTASEKLHVMMLKNPALAQLKEKLELDIE